MKKLFTLLAVSGMFIVTFSCATAAAFRLRSDDGHPDSVTSINRPKTGPEMAADKTIDLYLPLSKNNNKAALRYLEKYAARLALAVKQGLEARLSKRLKKHHADVTEKRGATRTPVRPPVRENARTTPVAPPVRRVVNTPSLDGTGDRENVRTIYARQGDDIDISFNQNGWLCLELPPEGAGLDYVSRSIEGNKTFFKFRGRRIGEYSLPFQYQDNARGVMKRETIDVKVVAEKEFDAVMGARGNEAEKADREKRRAYGLKLYELGNFSEALRELLASYAEGDPSLNHLIAALALRQKDFKNAVLFWTKNLSEKGEWLDKAVLGLIRAYAGLGDRHALVGLVRALLAVKNLPVEEELGLLIHVLGDLRDETLVHDLLYAYLLRYPAGGNLAEVYYLLGRLHEFTRGFLDFKKAREYYGRVVREYPESPYFAPSRERIAFINRHYFKVQ